MATADSSVKRHPRHPPRFEYFRLLARLPLGQLSLEDLLTAQDRFDNHFLDSPEWRAARTSP